MANQFLSLALFLMLLSFFIVMNAISSFETSKSAPVINSLALAFSNRVLDREISPITPSADMSINDGDTLEVLEGLFNAHLASFQATTNRFGTVMRIKTPVGQFEKSINISSSGYNITTLGAKGSFIQNMISLLRSEKKAMPYRVDMVLNIPEELADFQKNYPNEFISNLKLVSSFAGILENAGLPKKMISIGLSKGDEGFIELYFYRYKPFNMYHQIKESSGE